LCVVFCFCVSLVSHDMPLRSSSPYFATHTHRHELGHVLGQSSRLMAYYLDEQGVPRTARDSGGFPVTTRLCADGTTETSDLPSNDTLALVVGADGRTRQYVVTPRVQAVARNQFNCQSLPGARLQDEGDCFGDHWSERDWLLSLMSPVAEDAGQGSADSIDVLSLALLDDSGWYRVDYRGAAQPGYGIAAGCEFIDEPCIVNDNATESEFCDVPIALNGILPTTETLDAIYCDPSHYFWALCDLYKGIIQVEASDAHYFSDPNTISTFQAADGCPIPIKALGLNCVIEDPYTPFYPGESVGPQSRCIDAYSDRNGNKAFQPACMKVTCDADAFAIRIGEGDNEQICQQEGQELAIPGMTNAAFVCPRLATLCPELYACPDACFGRGVCDYSDLSARPVCRCFDATNSHVSCAPSYIIDLANGTATTDNPTSTATTSPAPVVLSGTTPPQIEIVGDLPTIAVPAGTKSSPAPSAIHRIPSSAPTLPGAAKVPPTKPSSAPMRSASGGTTVVYLIVALVILSVTDLTH
jgi:Leishmanolysin